MYNDSYCEDHRVIAGNKQDWYTTINKSKMLATVECEDENGITEVEVKICYEVCPTCSGKGSHVNPSIDSNGLSAEDFYEDPDFRHDYCSGMYDVTCYECKGERVVPAMDRNKNSQDVVKMIDDKLDEDARYEAELAHQRRYQY